MHKIRVSRNRYFVYNDNKKLRFFENQCLTNGLIYDIIKEQ